MSASNQVKASGLRSLAYVARVTSVRPDTLQNWHKHRPELFAVVLAGCKTLQDKHNGTDTSSEGPASTSI
jgi:hypothetical protein